MGNNILIIGMNHIGDTLFTTPLIKNLKEHYKDCSIDIVNGASGSGILKNNKYINEIIIRPKEKKEYQNYIEKLKSKNYTLGYSATPSFYGAYDLYKAGIKIRVGVDSECRGLFLTHSCDWKKHSRYIIETILSPLTKLDIPIKYKHTEIYLTDEEKAFASNLLSNYEKPCIIHLGATRISKRYPINKFACLIQKIKNETTLPIILVGSGNIDLSLANELKEIVGQHSIALDLTNKLSIRELCAVLSMAYIFVGGDSGPLHISSSFDVKTLGIFGDSYSKLYGARGANSINTKGHEYCNKIKSYYCEHFKRGCNSIECLNNIDYNYLFSLFLKLLSKNS